MQLIHLGSDNLVELVGPVNVAAGTAIISASSCRARLFYDDLDTTLRTQVSSGLVLSVQSTRKWAVGQRALVWLNTAQWHDAGLVTAVDHDLRTISITSAIPSLCAVGNRVSAALGTGSQHEVTMTFYQSAFVPAVGRVDYGFRGTIPDDQVGLSIGVPIRIEIDLDAAAGVRLTSIIRAMVTGGA